MDPPRPASARARILIVDDEESIREGLRDLIHASLGFEVDVARDAREALSKAATAGRYDLVVSDQRMPGMQGNELLAELRKKGRCRKSALMSAFYREYLDMATDEQEQMRFFAKPLEMKEFLDFIGQSMAA